MQDAWAADPVTCQLLTGIAETATRALSALGGVATVEELAGAVLAAMPPGGGGDIPVSRLVAGLLRLAFDRVDALERAEAGGPVLTKRRRGVPAPRRRRAVPARWPPPRADRRADDLVGPAGSAAEPV